MKDLYSIQMAKALGKVVVDASAGDEASILLLEQLSLEQGRQQRLARVNAHRVELNLPDTLQGRTEALERLNNG